MMEMASFVSHSCFPFFPSLFAVVCWKQQRSSHHAIIITTTCMALSRGTEFLPGTHHTAYAYWYQYGRSDIGGPRTYLGYICAGTRYLSNIQHVGLQGTSTRYDLQYQVLDYDTHSNFLVQHYYLVPVGVCARYLVPGTTSR